MIEIRLDGETLASKEQLHKCLAREFRFPSWYGENLDALYDCLTELHEDVRLIIAHSGKLLESLGPYGESLLQALRQAREDNPRFSFECE